MMELVKIINGEATHYTYERFRRDHNTTARTDEHLNPHGIFRVYQPPKPNDVVGKKLIENNFAELVEGVWTQLWVYINLGEDEARAERNRLLGDTDYTQLPDYPKADQIALATYRQELRDVPAQEGFPENVVWPEVTTNGT